MPDEVRIGKDSRPVSSCRNTHVNASSVLTGFATLNFDSALRLSTSLNPWSPPFKMTLVMSAESAMMQWLGRISLSFEYQLDYFGGLVLGALKLPFADGVKCRVDQHWIST